MAENDSPEIERLAFLIGDFRCDARFKPVGGDWLTFQATWKGRYILDGRVVADEYRMTGPDGGLLVVGMNIRSYAPATRTWTMKWLNAMDGTWMDLVNEELGGITFTTDSMSYIFREPGGQHTYTRATYTSHSTDHFTWRGEGSEDLKSWSEFMVVEAYRRAAP